MIVDYHNVRKRYTIRCVIKEPPVIQVQKRHASNCLIINRFSTTQYINVVNAESIIRGTMNSLELLTEQSSSSFHAHRLPATRLFETSVAQDSENQFQLRGSRLNQTILNYRQTPLKDYYLAVQVR